MRILAYARRAGATVARQANALLAFVASGGFVIVALCLAGAALGIGGVFLLAGLGWSLIAASAAAFGMAALISRGLYA